MNNKKIPKIRFEGFSGEWEEKELGNIATFLKGKIINLISGTTVFHLYAKDIERLKMYLPIKDEQIKIANYFQKLDQSIDLQLQELEKLKNIKKALLDKMFV